MISITAFPPWEEAPPPSPHFLFLSEASLPLNLRRGKESEGREEERRRGKILRQREEGRMGMGRLKSRTCGITYVGSLSRAGLGVTGSVGSAILPNTGSDCVQWLLWEPP